MPLYVIHVSLLEGLPLIKLPVYMGMAVPRLDLFQHWSLYCYEYPVQIPTFSDTMCDQVDGVDGVQFQALAM